MLNGLDPDQDRHFDNPDLGPNCLQRYQQTTKVDGFIVFSAYAYCFR